MRIVIAALAAFVMSGTLTAPVLAQASQVRYLHLNYVKVLPGSEAEYEGIEQDVWKPIHEERRRRGELLNWNLYRVEFSLPGVQYNYVAVHVYDDLSDIEAANGDEGVLRVRPNADIEAMTAQRAAVREVVHSEVWALVESVQPEAMAQPEGQYLAVNFMDVPVEGGAEYFSMEREVWRPIHQVRADEGAIGGWSLYSLVFPRGEAMNYRFGTVDFFPDLDAAAAGITGGEIARAHAGSSEAEVDAMMERTDQARQIYKTELWKLVGALGAVDG